MNFIEELPWSLSILFSMMYTYHFLSDKSLTSLLCTEKQCDLFKGRWLEDDSGPLYKHETCPYLSQTQDCPGNGRPDSGYLNWRWQPDGCVIPKFDAKAFLELMRGKTLAFVGDSVARNQYESLLCMLSQVKGLLWAIGKTKARFKVL